MVDLVAVSRPKASDEWRATSAVLAARIRAARIAAGIAPAALAERCGVTRATISNIEAERHSVSLEMLFRIARSLDLPPAALLEGVELSGALEPRQRRAETLSDHDLAWVRWAARLRKRRGGA